VTSSPVGESENWSLPLSPFASLWDSKPPITGKMTTVESSCEDDVMILPNANKTIPKSASVINDESLFCWVLMRPNVTEDFWRNLAYEDKHFVARAES